MALHDSIGRWHDNHADLIQLGSLDVGYSLVIADL
jgi:hypothetical protein